MKLHVTTDRNLCKHMKYFKISAKTEQNIIELYNILQLELLL